MDHNPKATGADVQPAHESAYDKLGVAECRETYLAYTASKEHAALQRIEDILAHLRLDLAEARITLLGGADNA